MKPEDIETIRKLIEQAKPHPTWLLVVWGGIAVLLFIAYLVLKSYLEEKGKRYATHEDTDRILTELKETTKATETIKSRIGQRSEFEKHVTLERFKALVAMQQKLLSAVADIRKHCQGIEVPGLLDGTDVVPLTKLYVDLTSQRWLIGEQFTDIIQHELDLAVEYFKAGSQRNDVDSRIMEKVACFGDAMRATFGLAQLESSNSQF